MNSVRVDPVARTQEVARMPATLHDFTVHFHRHPAFGEAEVMDTIAP